MRRILAAGALVVVSAGPAPAQTMADLCATIGNVKVGQWARYDVQAPQIPGGQGEIRFAIVGTENVEGHDHYWFELQMVMPNGPAITQFLIPEYPYDQGDIKAMVMKMADQPAMKMPPQMMEMMRRHGGNTQALEVAKRCGEAEGLGWEEVSLSDGTMRAMRIKPADHEGTVWVSADVPFGLVKYSGPEGQEMTLAAHGWDATSSITETPREMPGMPGMPPR